MTIFTKHFWKVAGVRAIKTFGQTFAALIATDAVGWADINLLTVLSASSLAAVASIATTVGSVDTPPLVEPTRGRHRADNTDQEDEDSFPTPEIQVYG